MSKQPTKSNAQGQYTPHVFRAVTPWIGLGAVFIVVLLIVVLLVNHWKDKAPPPPQLTTQLVTLGDQSYTLELALTDNARRTGLMYRESLPKNGGMLFVFPDRDLRQMYMKNCRIPLDVLFIDQTDDAGKIIMIHRMTVPDPDTPTHRLRKYSSAAKCQFAIELAGGSAHKLGLAEGDTIDLPYDRLKQRAR